MSTPVPSTPIVTLSCASEFKAYAADEMHDTCAVVTIKAESHKGHEDTRPSLDVLLVIDVSGSMDNVLPLVKNTAQFLVKRAADRDRVGIITYNNNAHESFGLAFMTQHEKARAIDCIDGIKAFGSTNMEAAIRLCSRMLKSAKNTTADRETAILFLTDGKPTSGISEPEGLCGIAREMIPPSATMHTFGYGTDYDADLMAALAKQHTGVYYFIKNDDLVASAFATCMGGLMSTVAKSIDVRLRVPSGTGIVTAVHAAVDVTRDEATGAHEFCLVDMQAGERRDVVVELGLAPHAPQGEPVTLFEVTARYYDVVAKELRNAVPATLCVNRPATLDSTAAAAAVDETVDQQRNRLFFLKESKRAFALVKEDKMEEARQIADAAIAKLKASASAATPLTHSLIEDLERARSHMQDREHFDHDYGLESASVMLVHASQRSGGLGPASMIYATQTHMNEIAAYTSDLDGDADAPAEVSEPSAKRQRVENDDDDNNNNNNNAI